MKFTKKN